MTGDLRLALRLIARNPALAVVVVMSLGAGIGVNTVVFSWLQAIVIHPLPGVSDSARLHSIETRSGSGGYPGLSWLEYRDLHDGLKSFDDLILFRMSALYLGESGRVERAYGQLVSGNYFSALGLRPALGRFFRQDEAERPGSEPVAVLSHSFWTSRFGGDTAVIGRTIRVNGQELTVIGVAPRRFQGTILGLNFDMWVPATLAPILLGQSQELENRTVRGYSAMGWLRRGVTEAQAQAEIDGAMAQLARIFPVSNAGLQAEVLTFWQSPRGPQRLFVAALAVLQALMLLLLLAVCGNVANLLLARASTRQREMGIRLALGATPWRAARLMLSENVVLALAGAIVGFAIAFWWTPTLIAVPLTGFPIRFQTGVDAVALGFAIVLGIVSGVLSGAVPAVHVSRLDPQVAFRAGARSAGRSRMRDVLMGIQVALALVVLIVAGLFLRSFAATRDADPGFRREGVLLAAYDLTGRPAAGDPSTSARSFASRALAAIRSLPSIEAAAISSSVPLDIHGLSSRTFVLEGHARADGMKDDALANTVTAGYFSLMHIPFLAGVDFAPLDDAGTSKQVIVNQAFVQRYFGVAAPAAALGRWLENRGDRYAIIGVVRNSIYNAFGEPPTPIVYYSYRDRPLVAGEIHARGRSGSETTLAPDLRRAVQQIDPDLPLFNVRTLTDHVETNLVFRRVPARLFAVLGPLLLALAASGIYAVASYTASLRTKEVGVRIALGATARRVIAGFVGQNLGIVLVGALAGWLVTLVIALDVVGVDTIDVSVFGGVPLLLLVVAGVACWLPARRAARVEPMVALRED